MKKSSLLRLLGICFLLPGCGPRVNPENPGEDEVVLEKDKSTSYNIDETISNVDGSMSYELFVRSFYDSDGNGIGDFNGVTLKLDYLKSLGIKTVWLMPIMPSPTYHGYDVTNYFDVNSDFGTLADFENMVKEANKRNIDIMLDMVFNHCSRQHPYFTQSYADFINENETENSKKDWFNWSRERGDSTYGGVYYEAKFDSSMPDFNLDCEQVREELEKIVKFWIEKGVKGFRLDAVLYYYSSNLPENVKFLNWLKETACKYDPNFYMVGEAWVSNTGANGYFSSKCDSFFRFSNAIGGDNTFVNIAKGYGDTEEFAEQIQIEEKAIKNRNQNAYASYFLSNHDQDRVSKNLSPEQNKVAASIYCLMPGTPFMYYGEEISLVGVRKTSPEDYSDVKRRLPMVWSGSDKKGECIFPEANRKDLDTTEQVKVGVEEQLKEPFSLLNHYRYVVNIRNKYPLFKHGVFTSAYSLLGTDNTHILAYKISLNDEYIYVVHNLSSENVMVNAPGNQILDSINTIHLLPKLSDGKLSLAAQSTVIMK